MEVLFATVLSEAGFFFFSLLFGRENCPLHLHATKETTSVKGKAIRSRSCKLLSQLRKRQTLKSAESQHVKQNKPSTCQLFTNSKHSLSISTQTTSSHCSWTYSMQAGSADCSCLCHVMSCQSVFLCLLAFACLSLPLSLSLCLCLCQCPCLYVCPRLCLCLCLCLSVS